MKESILQQFDESRKIIKAIETDDNLLDNIEQLARVMISSLRNGNAIYLAGNGGSAADAQHIAAELSGKFEIDRPPLNVEALHVNSSYLTAVANDYGYEHVFSRLLRGRGKRGDVFIALSTSGNSRNILNAAEAATAQQMTVIGMTGQSGGKLRDACDLAISIPAKNTARIQEMHIMVGHWLCKTVEQDFFGDKRITEEE